MEILDNVSRRSFLALFAAAPLWAALSANKHIPIGLELYSVRNDPEKRPNGNDPGRGEDGV